MLGGFDGRNAYDWHAQFFTDDFGHLSNRHAFVAHAVAVSEGALAA